MNYINKPEKLKQMHLTENNYYVVADFDRTITAGDSNSTWGSIADTKALPEEYVKERKEQFYYYRPIEIDTTIPEDEKAKYMQEWWDAHVRILYKYGLTEETMKLAATKGNLKFRKGSRELLENLNKKNIPLVIVSAGIGNIIKEFLIENNCDFDNITIISNFIEFENGVIKCLKGESINSSNKSIVKLPEYVKNKVEDKEYIILLGDGLADRKMVPEDDENKTISVGFLEDKIVESLETYNNVFDIVCTYRTGMDDAMQTIFTYTK